MNATSSPSSARFASRTTRWSLIARLGESGAPARDTLAALCARYGYPVYAHVRRSGHAPDAAHALTRAFFASLVEHGLDTMPREVRFRRWLLERLGAFLARPDRSSDPDSSGVPDLDATDIEARVQAEAGASASADAFERSFALEVLTQAHRRLRHEARDARRLELFAALEPYLAEEPSPGRLTELAGALRMPPPSVATALKRLRGRFRELVDAEIADTVASPDAFRAERAELLAVLEREA